MPSSTERMSILDRLEKGEITPEEAALRLQHGQKENETEKSDSKGADDASTFKPETFERFEIHEERFEPSRTWGWWFTLIAAGTILTLLAGLWMSSDVRDGSFGLGFFCAWLPLALGVLFIFLGVAARRGPWANLWINRRRRGGDTDVILNVPVPVGMAGTVLRTAGRHIPGLEEQDVNKLLDALQASRRKGAHITIQTKQDNEDEDIVDITIG